MKRAILLLYLSCAFSVANAKTLSVSDLVEKEGVFYDEQTGIPYSGRVESHYATGQMRLESFYKDGKKDGVETTWYEDGSLRRESGYKEGERHGEWIHWDTNHRPTFHRLYDNGERIY